MTWIVALIGINTALLVLSLALSYTAKRGDEIRRRLGVR